MPIDPRLNEIDDCLYRVAVRVIIVQAGKVLLIKEGSDDWWALPGGGVSHGETITSTLNRELEEELGIPAEAISCDFEIVHYNIGNVVNTTPRMNLFFQASIAKDSLTKTDQGTKWAWFDKDEFSKVQLHPSSNKSELSGVIFGK
jgi:8-oxo-dGTP pyrophosphatase MutT (NUDIX family)